MSDWVLPLTAGFVAAFNPCGVVLLPAYVTHLLAARYPMAASAVPPLLQGALAGTGMTTGVLVVFGLVGMAVTSVSAVVMRVTPSLAVAVGLGLLAYGGLVLGTGREPGTALGGRVQGALAGRGRGWFRFVVYGAAYGLASLGCTLPVFLAVVAHSLAAAGPMVGLSRFAAYALGMGLAVTALSVLSVLARDAAQGLIRRLLPNLPRLSGALLAGSGGYLVYYWLWGPGRLVLR
ncbi:MAG TPA: cytochrome c biogenesis protein CcdA [Bacillota bacterium]